MVLEAERRWSPGVSGEHVEFWVPLVLGDEVPLVAQFYTGVVYPIFIMIINSINDEGIRFPIHQAVQNET